MMQNKTRRSPSLLCLDKVTHWEEKEQTKESEATSLPLLGVPQIPQAKQLQHVCRKRSTDPSKLSESPCEPCLVDSVGHILLLFTPLAPAILPPHLMFG